MNAFLHTHNSATPGATPADPPRATATMPKTPAQNKAEFSHRVQIAFFNAATAKALTTVLAGFAFTTTPLPKISFFPAFVAGLRRVLIMHKPGIVHFPAFFTSCVATLARVSRTFVTCDFFNSVPSARACAKAPFVSGLPPFMPPFMAFIGAMAASGCGGLVVLQTGAD